MVNYQRGAGLNVESVDVRLGWQDQEGLPWGIALRFAVIDGKVQCAGFEVHPVGGNRPVTAALVRSVPVGRLVAEVLRDPPLAFTHLSDQPPFSALVTLAGQRDPRVSPESESGIDDKPRPGRPRKYGPEHYARVAQIYLEATTKPTKRVAEHFDVPVTRASNWVRTARDLGLLDAAVSEEPEQPAKRQRTIKNPRVVKAIRKAAVTDEQ